MLRRSVVPFVLVSLAALAGCSSKSGGSYGGAGSSTFSAYCTGTLSHDTPLMAEQPGGAWESGPGSPSAPSGTTFLLSDEFQVWQGYVIADDGTPSQVQADFTKGLVAGTDFTSQCATAAPSFTATTHIVLLAETTLYPSASLSGSTCTIAAGTELTQFDYQADGGQTVSVSSAEIVAKCGGPMFAKDFPYGTLVDR